MKSILSIILMLLLSPTILAGESMARSVIKSMHLVEIAIFKFDESYMKACEKQQSKEFCKKHLPEFNSKDIEDIYISAMEKVISDTELAPIIDFFKSENGILYNDILYQQTITGKQWSPSMPAMSKEKFSEINKYRESQEWKIFESKIPEFNQESSRKVQSYVYSDAAKAFEELASKQVQ